MRKADFFVVGTPPKGGTSTLCDLPAQHPGIYFSSVKELAYFVIVEQFVRHFVSMTQAVYRFLGLDPSVAPRRAALILPGSRKNERHR